MSDVNVTTPASKSHSEIIVEMSVIMSLAEVGELVAYPENDIELDSLSKLFRVIKERLDTLIDAVEK
ncbi:hypothetical protein [Candidatus Albibeggiatoa sp. nov. BB20]|uniref:hypothetical protein n=1 Tax=Candidatus Albibeggiatoa sp. nov. BB20 TaxID=3162723 RepID=UPI0033654776